MKQTVVMALPYPPTVNHYWRRVGSRTLISAEGRRYRERVIDAANLRNITPCSGSLDVSVAVYPPDRRRRDLDNILKALLDALQHAGVYEDDSQIDELHVTRHEIVRGGRVDVIVSEPEDE
jgi:crossover junction endodeoxyribonuclease RusA